MLDVARSIVRECAAALFPKLCARCGRAGYPICADCGADLRHPAPVTAPAGLDGWWAPFVYDGVVREIVARVKYRDERAAIAWLATHMTRSVPPDCFDIVTWPPTTAKRRRARGFDHAELFALAVGRCGQRPVAELLRRIDDRPQTGRSAGARRREPPAFALRARSTPRVVAARVLLVDDVATTGATLRAAAASLRRAGARSVVAVTAARALPPGAPRS